MGIFSNARDFKRLREESMQNAMASSPEVREALRRDREAKWAAEDTRRNMVKGSIVGGVVGGPAGAIVGAMLGKEKRNKR